MKIKLGILGASEIAFRRFLPALKQSDDFEYAGVASRDIKKAAKFQNEFGSICYDGYDALINDDLIGAVYIPLVPALHCEWAVKAIEKGKHVLVEKPAGISLQEALRVIEAARCNGVAVHENYMFKFHSQIREIMDILENGEIGEIRLYRIAFGFPKKPKSDFRYHKVLGGGALLDAGGYTVNLARTLLGDTVNLTAHRLNYAGYSDADVFGTATLENQSGQIAQISFGTDNEYKCELEVWGSSGTLFADRIFTAPPGFAPKIVIRKDSKMREITAEQDDHFLKSIDHFAKCIEDGKTREESYNEIEAQIYFVDKILKGE